MLLECRSRCRTCSAARPSTIFQGCRSTSMAYLLALSALFLLFVLVNGAFKYFINVRKGILGERMLRRMRYDLFALLLRFRPEDVARGQAGRGRQHDQGRGRADRRLHRRRLHPAGLPRHAGADRAPLHPGAELLAGARSRSPIVSSQAIVIPILRREQLRLGRERQIASRQLAGRIGEIVEGAPAIHGYGASHLQRGRDRRPAGPPLRHPGRSSTGASSRSSSSTTCWPRSRPSSSSRVGGYLALQAARSTSASSSPSSPPIATCRRPSRS